MSFVKLLIILTLFSFQSTICQEKNQLKIIDNFLQLEYPKNEPGAVVLIAKKGEIIFEKSYGLASIKPKKKLKNDMVFQIGSMSKQFVSAAILQLIEQGKMKLSDSIQKYVPYYPTKKYKITIHHLLAQTSGIPNYFDVDENEFYLLAQEHTPEQLINYYKDEPLQFEPNSKCEYSNSNYPLLGAALEKVTGMSLKDYLEQNIFDPLQMNSTGLWYRKETPKKKIVTGYNLKDGNFVPAPKMVGSALYAPGGIVSTANDLYLWNKALQGKTIISEFVANQLTTEKQTTDGKGTGYSFGFFLRNIQGSKTIQHGGNLFGFTTNGMYLPEKDIFICVLANTKFDRTNEVSNYMASVLIDKPIQIKTKAELSSKVLREYLGTFKLEGNIDKTLVVELFDNQLILKDPKNPKNNVFLNIIGKDLFEVKSAKAKILFIKNDKNEVISLEVNQNGKYLFKKEI